MKVLIIDGQGGGIGRGLVEAIKLAYPELEIIALGANSLATAAMLKAGANSGATGENAICYMAGRAGAGDVILGPMGIIQANAMLGEISPNMAMAIGQSEAVKILIPIARCRISVAGLPEMTIGQYIQAAVAKLMAMMP